MCSYPESGIGGDDLEITCGLLEGGAESTHVEALSIYIFNQLLLLDEFRAGLPFGRPSSL